MRQVRPRQTTATTATGLGLVGVRDTHSIRIMVRVSELLGSDIPW